MQLPQVASSAAAVAVGCGTAGGGRGEEGKRGFWHTDTERSRRSIESIKAAAAATCCNMRRPSDLDLCGRQPEAPHNPRPVPHSAAFNFNLNRKSATLLCCCCCLSGRDASLRFIWHLQQHRMRHCCCCCLWQVHMHWLWLLLLPLLLALACCKWLRLPLKVEDDAPSDCNNRAKT